MLNKQNSLNTCKDNWSVYFCAMYQGVSSSNGFFLYMHHNNGQQCPCRWATLFVGHQLCHFKPVEETSTFRQWSLHPPKCSRLHPLPMCTSALLRFERVWIIEVQFVNVPQYMCRFYKVWPLIHLQGSIQDFWLEGGRRGVEGGHTPDQA